MLSIIICSANKELLRQVTKNVERTVGIPFEVVAIENSDGRYGICEAYNAGASQSKYDVLCFMHEDILFHTENWGQNVINTLADLSIGLIGVAGGQAKTRIPEPWWIPAYDFNRIHLIQSFPNGSPSVKELVNPYKEPISDVVTVDGVWFCCRKEIWQQNRFDSETFKEFHFYDLDFAMQVFQAGHRVCVVYDVLIEHISPGSINRSWVENAVKFSKKWRKKLPVGIMKHDAYKWRKMELESCKSLLL